MRTRRRGRFRRSAATEKEGRRLNGGECITMTAAVNENQKTRPELAANTAVALGQIGTVRPNKARPPQDISGSARQGEVGKSEASAGAEAWVNLRDACYLAAVLAASAALAASALPASDLAYLRRKRSTRPAEQISTLMSPLWVERVKKVLPQAQCTRVSL